jgi:hypothetical protein
MEDVMGAPLGLCLVIGPFGYFVVVALVGTLHCAGRLLLWRGRPFLCPLTCPWHSDLISGGILQMGCTVWGFSSLAVVRVSFCSVHILPVFVGRHPSIRHNFMGCRVGGCRGRDHGEVHW